ncbi:MAG: S8/S53 family peptidase [Candidatus Lokiarchaeota archaeon]|nr:S8/S53 family peptidase [Candidatus Harpocratesius repetitus]
MLSYFVSENNRSWGTAFQYAIAQGVDVISLSQVSTYGSTPFFDEISECIEKYHIIFSAGTGNDNRGDPVLNATNNLRYPATHPDTLVVGGIIQNTHVNPSQWKHWNEGPGNPGSNWGRGVVNYNNSNYYSAVELVTDCKRHIAFSDYYGVSWAIPQIAGMAAALIYSNSLLTPSDVRILLISTAIQITPSLYNYTNSHFTNSTNWPTGWNPEVGYGMPDINLAITQALSIYI